MTSSVSGKARPEWASQDACAVLGSIVRLRPPLYAFCRVRCHAVRHSAGEASATVTVGRAHLEGQPVKPAIPLAALAASVVLAATMGVAQAIAGSEDVPGQISAVVIPRLTAIAYQWAAREGDPAPESVLAVRTTRAAALHLADPADTIPDSSHIPVYLVVERGHFHPTGLSAIRLPGTKTATSNLELILSATNLEVLDYGLGPGSKHRPAVTLSMLERLGPASVLVAPARQ